MHFRVLLALASATASAVAGSADDVEFMNTVSQFYQVMALAGNNTPAPTPDAMCIVRHCMGHVGKCAINGDCRSALTCTAGCGTKALNETCIFACTSDYENDVYDGLLKCMFNDNDCMHTKSGFDLWQACRSIDQVTPLTTYRGAAFSAAVARKLLLRDQQRGDWMVARGRSHAYDCFDCQFLYWVNRPDGSMSYVANYKIHKSDGGQRWNNAVYTAYDWPSQVGRYRLNASNYGGLQHDEDWRILAADEREDPKWVAMYYCGASAGVGEAYDGAFVITPDGAMPTDPISVAAIEKAYEKAGISLQCTPDSSSCSGHPAPPTCLADTLIV